MTTKPRVDCRSRSRPSAAAPGRLLTRLGWVLACLAASLMPGCGPEPAGAGTRAGAASMQQAVTAFQAHRYREAHDQAVVIMRRSAGPQREQAAYLAGLSAYQIGDAHAADEALGVASVSSDPQTSGRAKAMLGQLRLDQYRSREAAMLFADASRLLTGEDARRAAWHAGLAYRQGGDEASAKRWLNLASSAQFDQAPASDTIAMGGTRSASAPPGSTLASPHRPSTSSAVQPPRASEPSAAPASVGFTLQVGAFNDRVRARRAAEEAEALARHENLGRVRVILRKDAHGQQMYLVQIGWWVTRIEAAAARDRVGKLEYIVAPAAPLT